MKIKVRVKPGANNIAIEKETDGTYVVKVKERAQKGKANQAVVETIAEHFGVPRSSVAIIQGLTSRNKLIQIHGW